MCITDLSSGRNIEINYLLQRIEDYEGAVIPATNMHMMLGLKREYQKLGKVCEKTDFENDYDLVR